jgi:hypothetical protein
MAGFYIVAGKRGLAGGLKILLAFMLYREVKYPKKAANMAIAAVPARIATPSILRPIENIKPATTIEPPPDTNKAAKITAAIVAIAM